MKRFISLAGKTLVLFTLAFWLMAASEDGCYGKYDDMAEKKVKATVKLIEKQPTRDLNFSMDRFILNQRQQRLNDPNKMTYLYVVLMDGSWLKVTIIGKLASTSKRLSPPTEPGYSFPLPDNMGVWGSSDPAHVGMTTLGSLIEVGGFLSYVYSEVPLHFTNLSKPMIEMQVQASPAELKEFKAALDRAKQMRR